jgi:hypothetical protein
MPTTLSPVAAAPAAGTPEKVCVLCGEPFTEFGNNPWPTADDGDCCDNCNRSRVLPARTARLAKA